MALCELLPAAPSAIGDLKLTNRFSSYLLDLLDWKDS
jgi:hypothetical protein